jgi:phosphoribosylformylglycinamidine cyclo-ligase
MASKYTYKNSGVNIEAGEAAVRGIQSLVRSTYSSQVMNALGGYAGLFSISKKWKEPVLVASTDGVGTKLAIASLMNKHDTIGIDLVAMSVNDLIVSGATPLFFLDYFATGALFPDQMIEVVKGITKGCRTAGCSLIGGETAEMPSFYEKGKYDLAGFAVGIVEKKKRIDGKAIRPDDLLIGLASSGLHSNGYSLARKVVFEKMGCSVHDKITGLRKTVGETLLAPTVIYAKPFLKLNALFPIKGAAHITGGGMTRNIPRILPKTCMAKVDLTRLHIPKIFQIIQREGNIDLMEMFSTFNMGIGMVLIVDSVRVNPTLRALKGLGQKAFIMGEVVQRGKRDQSGVVYV